MTSETKPRDLEERTYEFARDVRSLVKKVSRTIANIEDGKQLVRASGSAASNYIEANEALSKKDFLFRIKICRKEAKESALFPRLLDVEEDSELDQEIEWLRGEANELKLIFSSIVNKSE